MLQGFLFYNFMFFKHDDLAAIRYVWLVLKFGPGNGYAVDDQAIAGVKRFFHTWAFDVKATKNEGVNKNSAD